MSLHTDQVSHFLAHLTADSLTINTLRTFNDDWITLSSIGIEDSALATRNRLRINTLSTLTTVIGGGVTIIASARAVGPFDLDAVTRRVRADEPALTAFLGMLAHTRRVAGVNSASVAVVAVRVSQAKLGIEDTETLDADRHRPTDASVERLVNTLRRSTVIQGAGVVVVAIKIRCVLTRSCHTHPGDTNCICSARNRFVFTLTSIWVARIDGTEVAVATALGAIRSFELQTIARERVANFTIATHHWGMLAGSVHTIVVGAGIAVVAILGAITLLRLDRNSHTKFVFTSDTVTSTVLCVNTSTVGWIALP